jgi:hypothetical protein
LSGGVEQALRDLLRSVDRGIIEKTAVDILKVFLYKPRLSRQGLRENFTGFF